MSKLPIHHCTDSECPSFRSPSSKSCKCHKDTTAMLLGQRDALYKALKGMMDWWDDPEVPASPGARILDLSRNILATVEGK